MCIRDSLDGINIIGVKAHQVADLVNLVILLRKLAAVVKHPLAQVGSCLLYTSRCV